MGLRYHYTLKPSVVRAILKPSLTIHAGPNGGWQLRLFNAEHLSWVYEQYHNQKKGRFESSLWEPGRLYKRKGKKNLPNPAAMLVFIGALYGPLWGSYKGGYPVYILVVTNNVGYLEGLNL